MPINDQRGQWRKNKTQEELKIIYAKQLAARQETWSAKPLEEKKAIVEKRSVSLKATWDKKEIRTNSLKGISAKERYGAERAAELSRNTSQRMLENNPMVDNAEIQKKVSLKRKGQPNKNKGKSFPQMQGDLNPAKRPEVRSLISESKLGKMPLGNQFRWKCGIREDLGFFVRSSYEANYARFLKLRGIEFSYEPKKFKLLINEATSWYMPDFILPQKGIVVEIKGWCKPTCLAKVKAFKQQIKEYKIVLIGYNQYKRFSRKFRDLIPNFEFDGIRRDYTLSSHQGDDIVRSVQQCTELDRNSLALNLNEKY